MKIVERAKQNPLGATAATLITVAIGIVAVWQAIALADKVHTTEAELLLYDLKAHTFATQQFASLETKLGEIEIIGQCRWLLSEIRALKDSIYVRKRDKADPDHINDLENDLDELEDLYSALFCARKLA